MKDKPKFAFFIFSSQQKSRVLLFLFNYISTFLNASTSSKMDPHMSKKVQKSVSPVVYLFNGGHKSH